MFIGSHITNTRLNDLDNMLWIIMEKWL